MLPEVQKWDLAIVPKYIPHLYMSIIMEHHVISIALTFSAVIHLSNNSV